MFVREPHVVPGNLRSRLVDAFRWAGEDISDPSGWWRDPGLLNDIAAGLADLHRDGDPSVVVGTESRGLLLGPLVAQRLGVGFVEIRKNVHPNDVGEALHRRTTPPDYNHRDLVLTLRRHLIAPNDRVVMVDDWIESGGQATAVNDLVVLDAGSRWVGAAVIVDASTAAVRRGLRVRSLLRTQELPW